MHIRSGQTFAINGVTADFGSDTLRDKSGNSIDLRPQAFAVFRYLVDHADRLVTKDELMRAVWPSVAVTDDSLVQCIHEIRRALHDEEHALLKTVPKRGYRLVLPADTAPGEPHDDAGPRSRRYGSGAVAAIVVLLVAAFALWWFAGRGTNTGAPPAGQPVIAVLPFDNLSGDPEQDYFADGITDDLITDLSKISGVLVIARNSVWPYKGEPVPVKQVASELGAHYVVEGSVQRVADQVRINAQLIDPASGHHLWADRYDGRLRDVFALQNEVIGHIVSALAVELTTQEQAEAGHVETINPQAYDALLLGLEHLHRDTEEETLKAIELFEQAVTIDPEYSRAHAALAAANWRIVTSYWFVTAGAGWQHAYEGYKKYLAKAMERPTALAYATLADNLRFEGRYGEAFGAIDKATALAPGDPSNHVVKASILNAIGRAPEAEAEVRLAGQLDPRFAPATLRVLALSLFNQEKYDEAIRTIERMIARQVVVVDDYMTLTSALGHLGRLSEVPRAIEAYNALALPAAYDTFTVQESEKFWTGDAFNYHQPYVDRLVEGLRKAGVPEGAGADLPLSAYKPLMTRALGEYNVKGATKVDATTAKPLHDRGVPFVDLRAHLDYDNGHVPGAINLSLFLDLSKQTLTEVVDADEEVLFYCHGKYCPVSAYGSAKAIAWGWRHVYYFAGGFPAWQDAGYPVEVTAREPSP